MKDKYAIEHMTVDRLGTSAKVHKSDFSLSRTLILMTAFANEINETTLTTEYHANGISNYPNLDNVTELMTKIHFIVHNGLTVVTE